MKTSEEARAKAGPPAKATAVSQDQRCKHECEFCTEATCQWEELVDGEECKCKVCDGFCVDCEFCHTQGTCVLCNCCRRVHVGVIEMDNLGDYNNYERDSAACSLCNNWNSAESSAGSMSADDGPGSGSEAAEGHAADRQLPRCKYHVQLADWHNAQIETRNAVENEKAEAKAAAKAAAKTAAHAAAQAAAKAAAQAAAQAASRVAAKVAAKVAVAKTTAGSRSGGEKSTAASKAGGKDGASVNAARKPKQPEAQRGGKEGASVDAARKPKQPEAKRRKLKQERSSESSASEEEYTSPITTNTLKAESKKKESKKKQLESDSDSDRQFSDQQEDGPDAEEKQLESESLSDTPSSDNAEEGGDAAGASAKLPMPGASAKLPMPPAADKGGGGHIVTYDLTMSDDDDDATIVVPVTTGASCAKWAEDRRNVAAGKKVVRAESDPAAANRAEAETLGKQAAVFRKAATKAKQERLPVHKGSPSKRPILTEGQVSLQKPGPSKIAAGHHKPPGMPYPSRPSTKSPAWLAKEARDAAKKHQ